MTNAEPHAPDASAEGRWAAIRIMKARLKNSNSNGNSSGKSNSNSSNNSNSKNRRVRPCRGSGALGLVGFGGSAWLGKVLMSRGPWLRKRPSAVLAPVLMVVGSDTHLGPFFISVPHMLEVEWRCRFEWVIYRG